jgi:hypothetical protein
VWIERVPRSSRPGDANDDRAHDRDHVYVCAHDHR